MTTFADRFATYISEVDGGTLVALYNEYADSNCYERIYGMEDFNDVMQGFEPEDIARQVYYGSFKPYADWFTFDGYGNVESIEYPEDYVDLDALCEWAEDHQREVTEIDEDAEDLYVEPRPFDDLTKSELWALRQEVVVGSMMTSDFYNSHGFSAMDVQTFFEGYEEHINDLCREQGIEYCTDGKFAEHDNAETLWSYFCSLDSLDWVGYED